MCAKDDRRSQIIQAAFQAFAQKGYDKTSMDDIVQQSGLSKGTLYWHFKNKHDLFLAVMDTTMQQMSTGLETLIGQTELLAAERLCTLFRRLIEFVENNKQVFGLMVNAFFQSSQSDAAQDIMWQAYRQYADLIEVLIQQGIDSGEFREVDTHNVAIMLMAAGDGIAMYTLLDPDWDLHATSEALMELTIKGLKEGDSPDT
ncbi:MAG: TetR/AcrR family transcriptional regulator [Anaerolineae bacterium]|nr:TetR/AcrR family transcriptional regulator [Anaerolineae bacterium]